MSCFGAICGSGGKGRGPEPINLMLAGIGGCGKSTMFSQMSILYKDQEATSTAGEPGFVDDDRLPFKMNVFLQLVQSMSELVPIMKDKWDEISDADTKMAIQNDCQYFFDIDPREVMKDWNMELPEGYCANNNYVVPDDSADALSALWRVNSLWQQEWVKKVLDGVDVSISYHMCHAKHFFDGMPRIFLPDYLPSNQDILLCRRMTQDVKFIEFNLVPNQDTQGQDLPQSAVPFRVYDVGGQKQERLQWSTVVQNVHAVVFVCAVNEYDAFVKEQGNSKNKLQQSLDVLKELLMEPVLKSAPFIIMLNKKDLLKGKVGKSKFSDYFTDYQDEEPRLNTYEGVIEYFTQKIVDIISEDNPNRFANIYTTCATDTDGFKKIFGAGATLLVKQNLAFSGIL